MEWTKTRIGYRAVFLAAFALVLPCEAGVGFGEPKVIKLDWSTRSLQAGDLNGDGLLDLAVINNDTAQVELLYQQAEGADAVVGKTSLERDRWEPVFGDAGFVSDKVTIGFPMFDLGVGDLNGDGRTDLAYSARDTPLTVRYQGENGHWLETQEFDGFDALGWHSTLKVVDLDQDGAEELVLLSADAVRVFSQDDSGRLEEAGVYFLTGENPFNLEVQDVTGDGRAEICYISSEGKQSLVIREQLESGGFGAERRFLLERPVRMYAPVSNQTEQSVRFVTVDSRSGALEFMNIARSTRASDELVLEGVQPQVYPVFKKVKEGAHFSLGDLNGDGELDLQVANPAGSELLVFLKQNGRFLSSKSFPSFSAISSLTSGRFFEGQAESVVALSRDENTLGVSHLDEMGRVSFPRLITVGDGAPLVCEAIDLDRDGRDELALVQEGEDGMQMIVVRPVARKDPASDWEVVMQMDLPDMRRKPSAIGSLDVFGPQGAGLILFIPREAPLLLAAKDGTAPYELALVGTRSSIRESLLKGLAPAQVSAIDVDGDGQNELVAARTGFARAIRIRGDALEMVDQFNARRSGDDVAAVIPVFGHSGLESLVLYVPAEGEFQFLRRDADGVLRYRHTENVGSIELSGWSSLPAKSGENAYLLYGEDRFWYFAPHADSWTLEVGESYETALEDVYFSYVAPADFDLDGRSDLIAVDGNEHVVEIVDGTSGGDWKSRMYWQIFDQNMHYQGRTGGKLEPRQAISADLNGDGRLDFAFLIHDRIIFYPQE